MTKILSRKCAVEDKSGDIKIATLDFNILYAIQMDIENYNYIDMVFRDYRAGKLNHNYGNDKKNDKSNDLGLDAGVSYLTIDMSP